jgi:hypothetical protein
VIVFAAYDENTTVQSLFIEITTQLRVFASLRSLRMTSYGILQEALKTVGEEAPGSGDVGRQVEGIGRLSTVPRPSSRVGRCGTFEGE